MPSQEGKAFLVTGGNVSCIVKPLTPCHAIKLQQRSEVVITQLHYCRLAWALKHARH